MPAASMKALLGALMCLLLADTAAAAKLKAHKGSKTLASNAEEEGAEVWCEGNKFPYPEHFYTAEGKSKGDDIIGATDMAEFKRLLKESTSDWQLTAKWQFKAKVTSAERTNLVFGFPGGDSDADRGTDGGFLEFTIAPGASNDTVSVVDVVKATADEVQLEYRTGPAIITYEVVISNICLRPMLCADFAGCLPDYHYRNKASGVGDSVAECCEKITCKDSLPNGCAPSTQWKTTDDFETRLGISEEYCCIAQVCDTTKPCDNSSLYGPKQGTGLLGSTIGECCNMVYCIDYPSLCDVDSNRTRLPDLLENGSHRPGSVADDCCSSLLCEDFVCEDELGRWGDKANKSGPGHTFEHCCEPLFCANFSECIDSTQWSLKDPEHRPLLGSSTERCCVKKFCKDNDNVCDANKSRVYLPDSETRQGSTDAECCEDANCLDYKCSDAEKWEKKPMLVDNEKGDNIARKGFSDTECCNPLYCRNFECDASTKWKPILYTDDNDTLGNTFERCCERRMCETHTCTTDWDGDGNGTKWYKRQDTNAFKWQGSTDEECCHPLWCSQYRTQFPTKWQRKADPPGKPLQGSTDNECYEKVFCDTFCCDKKKGRQHIPDAKTTQGSTEEECCENLPSNHTGKSKMDKFSGNV